ncbi:unnamed protein product [Urochloa humidicola]
MESGHKSGGGSAAGGDGVLCHACGYQYPNGHPSAKQRRAHRKHCGKPTSAAAAGAEEGAGEHESNESLPGEGRSGVGEGIEASAAEHGGSLPGSVPDAASAADGGDNAEGVYLLSIQWYRLPLRSDLGESSAPTTLRLLGSSLSSSFRCMLLEQLVPPVKKHLVLALRGWGRDKDGKGDAVAIHSTRDTFVCKEVEGTTTVMDEGKKMERGDAGEEKKGDRRQLDLICGLDMTRSHQHIVSRSCR